MIFHSLEYIMFLPAVFCLYWMLPRKAQNVFLLGASYFFYGYIHPWFLSLIFASTIIDYFCGLGMRSYPDRKRLFLILSLAGNLGMLGFFKYYNFFIENVDAVLGAVGLPLNPWTLKVVLPVGISFYTFQTLSYTIDIYRGKLQPRTDFIDFAVFVSFFPQLVAGPIERASRLLPQFEEKRALHPGDLWRGMNLILWGYFKKLVIADNVSVYANKVLALQEPSFLLLWAGVSAFTIQLYADFSAYSDIARGSARLLGFRLMRNFNHPYSSLHLAEFWKRWHISLSTWLRDYVLLSLHRTKWMKEARRTNVMLTFLVCGLWHGASWNFVVWGIATGLAVTFSREVDAFMRKIFGDDFIGKGFRWLFFVFFIIHPLMLLFREHDLGYIVKYFTLNPFANTLPQMRAATQIWVLTFFYSIPLWIHAAYSGVLKRLPENSFIHNQIVFAGETAAAMCMFIGIITLHSISNMDFVYFQF